MALSIAQQTNALTSNFGNPCTVQFGSAMGAGNLIVVIAANNSLTNAPTSITDSAGNTYVSAVNDTGVNSWIWYCLSGKAYSGTGGSGNLVSVHFSGNNEIDVWAMEVTGATSWTAGPTAFAPPFTNFGTTYTVGPVNLTSEPAFLAAIIEGNTVTGTGPNFANLTGSPYGSDLSGLEYIATSPGNVTAAPTGAGASYYGCLAAFYGAKNPNTLYFGSD